jgi:lipoprotein-releasing system permease protein
MFHPLEWFVGIRYVWSRRRRGLISFMSGASLCGVALGVAALIIVLSVMNGLEAETRNRLLSLSAHATLTAESRAQVDWERIAAKLYEYQDVEYAAPFIDVEGMLSAGSRLYPALIRGIDPEREAEVFPEEYMIEGSFADLRDAVDGIVIGRALAGNLAVTLGDRITLLNARIVDGRPQPALVPLRVVGVFSARIADHDAGLALIHIQRAAAITDGSADRALGIRVGNPLDMSGLHSFVNATPELAGFAYSDWTQEHRSHFRAIRIEKTMISLMLLLIIAIAAFNIVASLMMVVNAKSTDIAILRTLGLEPRRVAGIFVFQGSIIGIAGMLTGTLLGVLVATNISVIVPQIESMLGMRIMPPDV